MKDWIRSKIGNGNLAKIQDWYSHQSRMQIVWLICLIATLPFFYGLVSQFFELYNYRIEQNPTYDWPSFWDLKTALSSCFLLFYLKTIMIKLLTPFTIRIISEKYTGDERQDKAEKAAQCFFKSAYFLCAVSFGYLVVKDAPFLPPIIGGTGDAALIFDGYPYFSYEKFPLIRPYIMIQLGYHLFSLLHTIMTPSRRDYLEMLLHHVATATLIIVAYLMNYTPISALILLTLDSCDIFVYALKAWIDSKYSAMVALYFFLTTGAFLFFRLYVYPCYLLYHAVWYNNDYYQEIPGFYLLACFLHLILCLHVYWLCLILKLGLRFARTGKRNEMHHDDQTKLGSVAEEETPSKDEKKVKVG